MQVIDRQTNQLIVQDLKTAYTFWARLKGLMMTKSLSENAGLHIAPCPSIHTFFMTYSIDVIYLNERKEVIGIEENLSPGKIGRRFSGAKSVIELPAGRIREVSITAGQVLAFVNGENEQVS
ncbi:hypothetical protein GCM10010954_29710 [Halobacillus andaensis]|uniref:DUF192 domain-containing protein n=1 Tax=Halobacillus andaensis TaxID=1176239 RepID=A0A917B752_HALAA|nr:DUF192 domain-containing protein [Halobacillus andaensis]MBP2005075.1 uncharacterized membrane protein (UPF0127 family) [Halobacillus andaensis]GGF28688.1 hypothetical protein GCM10010954_29710 [Halobacillus andaensis]